METKQLYKKKGQAGAAVSAVITLIVGVGVSVLVLIFVGALGGQTYNLVQSDIAEIGNSSIINESFTPITNTAVSLSNDYIHSGTLTVFNSTNPVGLGNFTINYGTGAVTLTNNAYNNTALLASYSHGDLTIQEHVKGSITSGFSALEQTGNYLPIIVLAVVISLVLTLVLGFTMFGNKMGGNSAL